MKKILFLLLAFPLFALAQTEQYYVTFLKGTVVLQRTKQPLKPGDKISAEDNYEVALLNNEGDPHNDDPSV